MSAISPVLPAIEWSKPIVHDRERALEDAGCFLERASSLLSATINNVLQEILPDVLDNPGLAAGITTSYLHLRIVEEKIEELDKLIQAIIVAKPEVPSSSVGKHVELRRSLDWAEVVDAYKAAEGPPYTDESIAVAGMAFDRLLNTRAPNLRCLHEKMSIIVEGSNWSANGLADSLLADVEALARKLEISAPSAEAVGGN